MIDAFALLNHLYLSVDTETYAAIKASEFLKTEFAVCETRTTVRKDYPDGYTGLYFYGQETYFEFFDADNSIFPLGQYGIASGYEDDGDTYTAIRNLAALDGVSALDIDRAKDDSSITWFTSLMSSSSPVFGNASFWGMIYHEDFTKTWLGGTRKFRRVYNSVKQEDILQSYAYTLEQEDLRASQLMTDIEHVSATLKAEHLDAVVDQFVAFGWQSIAVDACYNLLAVNSSVTLCPSEGDDLDSIKELRFRLSRSGSGLPAMTLGTSTLSFSDRSATWVF